MAHSTFVLVIFSIVVVGVFSYPLDSTTENDTTAKDSFQPVSLPTDFGSYDPNANGYIDLEELAKVTGTTVDDARKPFMDADIDDDDQVSPAEFERAPWSLSLRNREEVISEDDNDDENEELKAYGDDDGEEVKVDNDDDGEEEVKVDNDDDGEEEVKVDNDDDGEEEVKIGNDDGEEEEAPMDESDDTREETPVDETDEEEAPTDESDYEEEDVFDNADDMLVGVGKYSEDDADDEDKSPAVKANEDEDDDSQSIEGDEVEADDAVDPLLVEKGDPLSRQEDVISENEFVENAIF